MKRTFVPKLPRDVWIVQAGMLVNSAGTGAVLPFLIIYLHDVRGIPLATAGLVAGAFGIVGLVATFLAGPVIDRTGDKAVLLASLLLLSIGYAMLAWVEQPWQAAACLAVAGLGNGALWPAQSVLLVRVVPADARHVAFSVNRLVGNAGLGLGVVLGALLVAHGDTTRYQLLFLLDGASFALFALLLLPLTGNARPDRTAARGSYREVARDRRYVVFLAANTVFVAAGYAQLEVGLPYFARHQVGVGSQVIGLALAANIVAVVVLQLPVARIVEGRLRTRMLAAAGLIWAAALAAVAVAGLAGSEAVGALVLVVAAVGFGIAECLHGSTASPLAADLAPEETRGRYMALVTSSFAVGFTVGPAVAGVVLGSSPYALWPLSAAACVLAGGAMLALERRLPEAALLTPRTA